MTGRLSQEEEVYIRIPDKGMDFVCTVKRGEDVLQTVVISPGGRYRVITGSDSDYYGDSRVVD